MLPCSFRGGCVNRQKNAKAATILIKYFGLWNTEDLEVLVLESFQRSHNATFILTAHCSCFAHIHMFAACFLHDCLYHTTTSFTTSLNFPTC